MSVMSAVEESYSGSHLLQPIAVRLGLPVDQLNFVSCQLLGLCLGHLLRTKLSPQQTSSLIRHLYSAVIGLFMGFFCYGWQMLHVIVISVGCYLLIKFINLQYIHRCVFAFTMTYLAVLHYKRFSSGSMLVTIDISGAVMVLLQKMTSLSVEFHDENENTHEKSRPFFTSPSAVEFFCYACHFQTLMTGPCIFYSQYLDFISPIRSSHKNIESSHLKKNGEIWHNSKLERCDDVQESPVGCALRKVCQAICYGILMVTLLPLTPIRLNADAEFIEGSCFCWRVLYAVVSSSLSRTKYYFAWIMADAICNMSGLGFNGYDKNGRAKWDGVSNVDVWKFETGLTFRDSLSNWNRGSMRWLRITIYNRSPPTTRTLITYTLSALWHGFFPGYYCMFFTGALFTTAARKVRRVIRPYMVGDRRVKFAYDVVTFLMTRLAFAYIAVPFFLLDLTAALSFFRSMYFSFHWAALFAIVLLPILYQRTSGQNADAQFPNNKKEE